MRPTPKNHSAAPLTPAPSRRERGSDSVHQRLVAHAVRARAFFAQPLNDVQVDLVIYDITNGAHDRKASTEQFMNRGDRVLFNSAS